MIGNNEVDDIGGYDVLRSSSSSSAAAAAAHRRVIQSL